MATDKTAYWLDIANEDLEVAEDLFKTKRWLYVAFMCHQVIEKTFKAYWCSVRDDEPPYVHNHRRLAEGCGLYEKMSDEQRRFLGMINNMNIEARYPDYKTGIARSLSEQKCREIIDKTKTDAAMDNTRVLTRDEALQLVRDYKRVITPRFSVEPKVFMYGSYSKGYPKPESDIDVAVIVPYVDGDWLTISTDLWLDVDKVNILIEPVLLEEGNHSPLYDDVMRTGVAV